jgi:AcrR family transcriptional regulator
MSEIVKKNKLTLSQRRVAEILATNDIHKMTVQEIADEVGVDPRTIYRWKKDPEFIKYQNAIADTAMEDFLTEAYTKLKTLLREGKTEKTQLEALKLVLQNRGKLKDTHDINVSTTQQETQEERERRIIEMENELLGE